MARRPRPSDVFTPGGLPLARDNVYARRSGPEDDLRRILQRQQIPLVLGEFGVGKTSLVRRFLQDENADGCVVHVPVSSDTGMDDVFRYTLEVLKFSVTVSRETARAVQGGFGFRGLSAKAEGRRSERAELIVTSPTDLGMIDVLAESRVTLVFDEMHKAGDGLRTVVPNLIKTVKSTGQSHPRIIIVGTTLDAERLVQHDQGVDRYVKEVSVPLLADKEARYIIREGFDRLGIAVADDLVVKVVRTAAGAPTIVHHVALEMAELVQSDGREEACDDDFVASLQMYLEEHGRRLLRAYLRAIETTGPKRWRRRILHAMASLDGDYSTMEQLRQSIFELTGEEATSANLGKPLQKLKSPDCGRILQDVERYEGGNRVFNLSAFSDPMMKSFVRFMASAEGQGVPLPPLNS